MSGGPDIMEALDAAEAQYAAAHGGEAEQDRPDAESTRAALNAYKQISAPEVPDDPLISEMIECGEMFAIVGQSKAGKSFFALQLCVCVAAGIPFLGRAVKRTRTYIANLEISAKQFTKRLRRMCDRLDVKPEALDGWLFVDNLKSEDATWERALDTCKVCKCGFAMLDPFYRIFKDDENNAAACTEATAEMGKFHKEHVTLGMVFHSPKGFSGDRNLIDSISGSSILARFPESVIGLLNHAQKETCRVVSAVLRNYAMAKPFAVEMDEGVFTLAPDVAPDVETARTRMANYASPKEKAKRNAAKIAALEKAVREIAAKGELMSTKAFRLEVGKTEAGAALSKADCRAALDALLARGDIIAKIPEKVRTEGGVKGVKNGNTLVGSPERVREYVAQFERLPL